MERYICNVCDTMFSAKDAAVARFIHNEDEHGGVEEYTVCPTCGSTDYDDMGECVVCHEPKPKDKLHEGLCDECREKLTNAMLEAAFILENLDAYSAFLVDMQNAEPKPSELSGKWEQIGRDKCGKRRFSCSKCGKWQTYGETDYCPNCGAYMKGK